MLKDSEIRKSKGFGNYHLIYYCSKCVIPRVENVLNIMKEVFPLVDWSKIGDGSNPSLVRVQKQK